jgi:malate dehydrogenase (oxaloacetate-decarboxylating)
MYSSNWAVLQACSGKLLLQALQWEDFATPHARPILQRYRHQLLTFNDDIQGTSAVALGAILGAVNVTEKIVREQDRVFLTKQEFLKIQGWRQC